MRKLSPVECCAGAFISWCAATIIIVVVLAVAVETGVTWIDSPWFIFVVLPLSLLLSQAVWLLVPVNEDLSDSEDAA